MIGIMYSENIFKYYDIITTVMYGECNCLM